MAKGPARLTALGGWIHILRFLEAMVMAGSTLDISYTVSKVM